jgi:hypothetical protein
MTAGGRPWTVGQQNNNRNRNQSWRESNASNIASSIVVSLQTSDAAMADESKQSNAGQVSYRVPASTAVLRVVTQYMAGTGCVVRAYGTKNRPSRCHTVHMLFRHFSSTHAQLYPLFRLRFLPSSNPPKKYIVSTVHADPRPE